MAGPEEDTERLETGAQQRVLDAIESRQVADFTALPEARRRLSASRSRGR